MDSVDVDCGTCSVRGLACGDCVISVLLGPPDDVTLDNVSLDGDTRDAIDALAGAGLVPPLRLVRAVDHPDETEPLWTAGPAVGSDPWRRSG